MYFGYDNVKSYFWVQRIFSSRSKSSVSSPAKSGRPSTPKHSPLDTPKTKYMALCQRDELRLGLARGVLLSAREEPRNRDHSAEPTISSCSAGAH
jgi:hypothetical protein